MLQSSPISVPLQKKIQVVLGFICNQKNKLKKKYFTSLFRKKGDFRPPCINHLSLPHHPKECIPFVKGGEQRIWKRNIKFGFFFFFWWGADLSGGGESHLRMMHHFWLVRKDSFSPLCSFCSSTVKSQGPRDAVHSASHLHGGGSGGCTEFCSAPQLQH